MSAAKIAASLRFIGWTGRLGSSSSEYSELGNRYETFQAQIATAWFLGSDRPLFGGAARLNARSRRSAFDPDRVKTRTPGRQFMNFSRFSAFSAITGPAERKNSLQMRRFQTIFEFSHGLDPQQSYSRSRAGTHTAPILHRNRPFPGARPKGLGHQRQLLLGGVTRPVILPTSPSPDDARPSLNA